MVKTQKTVTSAALQPANLIMTGEDKQRLLAAAKESAAAEFEKNAVRFNGREPYFEFDLRYTQPFDSRFVELRRLQGTALENVHFQSEYLGYIIINLSAYIGREEDEYFDLILKFLSDMNDGWYYIFLIEGEKSKISSKLITKVLSMIPCRVCADISECDIDASVYRDVCAVCNQFEVGIDKDSLEILGTILKRSSCGILRAIVSECAYMGYTELTKESLYEYLSRDDSCAGFLITDEMVSGIFERSIV